MVQINWTLGLPKYVLVLRASADPAPCDDAAPWLLPPLSAGLWSSGWARAAVKSSQSTRPPEVPDHPAFLGPSHTCFPTVTCSHAPCPTLLGGGGRPGPVSWSKASAVVPSAGCLMPSLRTQIHCNPDIFILYVTVLIVDIDMILARHRLP